MTTWRKSLGYQHFSVRLPWAGGGDWYSAIRLAAIDQANAAWMQGNLNDGTVNQILQTVNGHAAPGRLTGAQAAEINGIIYNLFLNRAG